MNRIPTPSSRALGRAGLFVGICLAGLIASATPAFAHAGFSSYAGFSYQPNPLGSTTSPYAPGTRYTLVVRAAVETTSPFNGSDDTDVKVEINIPAGWTDPACGSALLQVNNSGTGYTNQPGAAVNTWSCSVLTVGSNKVIRFTGPQIVAPATKADSAQFFSFLVTTPSPNVKTTYSGADGTQGFIVDQTYASGANSHWYPNAAYQGTAPEGTTRNELATGLLRTVNPAPGSPTRVIATRRNEAASVSWTAPLSDGGSAITGYRVTTFAEGVAVDGRTCSTSSTSCTVTGLTNGVGYTFSVTATNALGNSAPSSPSQVIAPRASAAGAPGRPTGLTLDSARLGSFAIRWTAPSSNGGSSITGYTASATSTGLPTRSCTVAFGTNSCTITGLTNGSNYTVSLVATNVAGDSGAAKLANLVPIGVPGAPSPVTASQTSRTAPVKVAWPSAASNGSAITGYTVTVERGGITVGGAGCITVARTCSISGLATGTSYVIKVVAANAEGSGQSATTTYSTRS